MEDAMLRMFSPAECLQFQLGADMCYTESSMTALLHRLGYVYKKPKVVPGKADPEAQRAFLEAYEKLKQNKGEDDPVVTSQ